MKTVIILTDLEGISGVESYEQLNDLEHGGYAHCCERLMADTNAAIAGAFDGGAEAVLVEDGHGGGHNFLPGALDSRARQIVLSDGSYDEAEVCCFMQIGAHAMAGTLNGFLDHTQSSVAWHDYRINGRPCGEMAQAAAYLGAFGVPCTMISGDETACYEARAFFGDLETAAVKTATGRNRAHCLPDGEAERRIYEAARNAMTLRDRIRPFRPILPMELTLEYNRSDYCDAACRNNPALERLDARTVRWVVGEIRRFGDLLP